MRVPSQMLADRFAIQNGAQLQEYVAPEAVPNSIDERLTSAVERPVLATVVEIPQDIAQRTTRVLIDSFAYFNTRQIKAWRHPGREANHEAHVASMWHWLAPTLVLRKP